MNSVKNSYISKSVERILALPIFLSYEVRPECQYVLSNLAAGYTWSVGHAGR